MVEKAARINKWQLFYYKRDDRDYVSINIDRFKNQPAVTHHFRIKNTEFLIFNKTYSNKTNRTIKTRDQRKQIENLVIESAVPSSSRNISLVFKLANTMVSTGLNRKDAFKRARTIVQDPGVTPLSDKEKTILRQYGVDPTKLKSSPRKVPVYKYKTGLKEAIASKNLIKIYYKKSDGSVTGPRVLEPLVYGHMRVKGKTKRGQKKYMLRAYQVKGESTSKDSSSSEGWRMFSIENITYLEILTKTFNKPRPNYNPLGDKQLTVEVQAKFK